MAKESMFGIDDGVIHELDTAAQPSTSSDDSDTASPAASVTTTSPAARATSPVHVAATPENLYNTILDQDTPSLAALD